MINLIKYVKEPFKNLSERIFHYREGQLAIGKVERLEQENKGLENRILDINFRNQQEIQKIHTNYTAFLRIIAHDLKSPFGNILNFSRLYKEGEIEAETYFPQLEKILKSVDKTKDLLTVAGNNLPSLKEKSQSLSIRGVFNEFYGANKFVLDKEKIGVHTNCDEAPIDMPEPILNCMIKNSAGDAFNHAISYVNFSTGSDEDHLIYKIENDTDGEMKRRIHGEGNRKGRPFLKHLVEGIYQGKVESREEDGKYFLKIYLPRKNVQIAEPKS